MIYSSRSPSAHAGVKKMQIPVATQEFLFSLKFPANVRRRRRYQAAHLSGLFIIYFILLLHPYHHHDKYSCMHLPGTVILSWKVWDNRVPSSGLPYPLGHLSREADGPHDKCDGDSGSSSGTPNDSGTQEIYSFLETKAVQSHVTVGQEWLSPGVSCIYLRPLISTDK